jgi:hypothetical protein
MQPFTQVSLDPYANDITYLRADQLFHGVIGCSIQIPPTFEEKHVAFLESGRRNTTRFHASITT